MRYLRICCIILLYFVFREQCFRDECVPKNESGTNETPANNVGALGERESAVCAERGS